MLILVGFIKEPSDNLPKVDTISMFAFIGKHAYFTGAELWGAKDQRYVIVVLRISFKNNKKRENQWRKNVVSLKLCILFRIVPDLY